MRNLWQSCVNRFLSREAFDGAINSKLEELLGENGPPVGSPEAAAALEQLERGKWIAPHFSR